MLSHQSIPEVEAATWKRIIKNYAKIIAIWFMAARKDERNVIQVAAPTA